VVGLCCKLIWGVKGICEGVGKGGVGLGGVVGKAGGGGGGGGHTDVGSCLWKL